jgi:hypothetical protein
MKQHNKTHRGYVNNSFGTSDSEVPRLDKAYGTKWTTIDFAFNQDLTPDDYPIKNATSLGTLIIGDTEIDLTKAECDKIMNTLHEAIQSSQKRYRLGIL